MSQPAGCGNLRCKGAKKYKIWTWLAISLLVLSQAACRPAGTPARATPSAPNLPTNSPASVRMATPTQAATKTSVPPTFTPTPSPTETSTPTFTPTATEAPPLIFAAIGDYGTGDQNEADVAGLVVSWNPEFIITLGDNNYPVGAADQIDRAVGQFFHSFIFPYHGNYGERAEVNRFFPSLGNHDIMTEDGKPYYDYFTLPGNERYYDFTWGPVHLFAMDDIETEPDGVGMSSIQAEWLKAGLAASTSSWNIVYMHYPAYSSGLHGSTDWARWPYKEWGADAVLAGHDHTYERLEEDGLTYFVNGLGGGGIYYFPTILEGSLARYNADYGAMRIEATDLYMRFEFISRTGEVVDSVESKK